MPLNFLVSTHQNMLLVDAGDPLKAPVGAGALLLNHKYDVFAFLQNQDPVEHLNVRIGISHESGMPLQGKAFRMRLLSPVDVPPQTNGSRTIVSVRFSFTPRASGTGYLLARILPDGPELNQCICIREVACTSRSRLKVHLLERKAGKYNGQHALAPHRRP